MKRILIVEDDQDIAVLEKDYLEASGYTADIVSDGAIVVSTILRGEYDLILLDLMLPNYSGYDICREIRGKIDVPILMVTARTESADKIKGLGLGADDYIAKPFDPAELVARVKSHLKRYQRLTNKQKPQPKDDDDTIYVSDLKILPRSWKVFRNHKEIRFPNREFELLLFLASHPNVVFSKEELFEKIWGYDYTGDSATVTVHIGRIREKIEENPARPRIIETVWGAGYRLNPS
ncbi:MAG TPA: response regulator transcription factor [Firmicutes bacterium]|nr:response regulator transcription factor [Bacillota bacterium]